MQVERRVKHIEPWTHRLDFRNRASVDLDTATTTDKAHDRDLFLNHVVHHRFDC
ncbi:hypothetical protein D3C81_2153400 [compost metagenome]